MSYAQLSRIELDCRGKKLYLSERTHVMGILNVTPDSFFDGLCYFDCKRAVKRAFEMVEEGADIIDVGGESTRPGADSVNVAVEMERVIPVIERLSEKIPVPISIDTRKSEVAEAAIRAGAHIINDISGLRFDPSMASVAARFNVPVVIMHIKGDPKSMQRDTKYRDLIGEIYNYLKEGIQIATKAGISKQKIIVDPGIGFGKKWKDNFIILKRLKEFQSLGCPLLIGVSRKSFIGRALDLPEKDRIMGTAAAVTASVLRGVNIVRVHDVKEMVQVVRIADLIKTAT